MASELSIKKLFESWADPVFLIDKLGKIIVANNPAKIFHPDLETEVGSINIIDIVGFVDEQYTSIVTNCLENSSVITISLGIKNYQDTKLKVDFQCWQFHYKSDVFIVLHACNFVNPNNELGNLHNITNLLNSEIHKRKRTESRLRKALNESRLAHEIKDKFLHQISHELRTPLNAILGMSEMMKIRAFGDLNSHYLDYAHDIHNCGQILLEIVEEILQFKDSTTANTSVSNLNECAHFAMNTVAELAHNKGLSLEILEEAKMPTILADNSLMQRILINLISNAVKYTPQGGKVKIAPEPDTIGEFCLIISDTGIGIRKRDLEHIFEPFFRAEDVYVRKENGLGMGLALTKKAVEVLGGHIDVNSHFGHGTKVRVCFPSNVIFGNA
ncbi:MAG: HAMP domain-containing sensor histidine kinase [Rickettsiales bacterium]